MDTSDLVSLVPANWIHPDLRRQMSDRSRKRSATRIEQLEEHTRAITNHVHSIDASLQAKRERLEQMEASIVGLRSDIEQLHQQQEDMHSLSKSLSNQVFYQKSIANVPVSDVLLSLQQLHEGSGEGGVEAAAGSLCTLDAHFVHLLDVCGSVSVATTTTTAATSPSTDNTDDESGRRSRDVEDVKRFLKTYAPLFSWTNNLEGEGKEKVEAPYFFDEPCQMEEDSAPCENAACAYWHQHQLQHLKSIAREFIRISSVFHSRDSRLCAVARQMALFSLSVDRAKSVDGLCCCWAALLQVIADRGWHRQWRSDPDTKTWVTPIVAAPIAIGSSGSGGTPPFRVDLVYRESEKRTWERLLSLSESTNGVQLKAAVQLFESEPTAIAWRCLTRVAAAGHSLAEQMWLAERGRDLFPSSPQLQVHYVLTALQLRRDAACLDMCMAVAEVLSTQGTAASLTQPQCTYAHLVARHIAYMIAMCASVVSEVDPTSVVAFLSAIVENKMGLCLLPVAQENFTMMLIALRQTRSLKGVLDLPLGAISDQLLFLSEAFPTNPQEHTGQLLNAQLSLINACQKDMIDSFLLDKMRCAVNLSLLRAFSVGLPYIEQIVRKSSPHSEIIQGTLWMEYIRCIAWFDNFSASVGAAEQLLTETGHGLSSSCLMTVLLLWYLEAHDSDIDKATLATTAAQKFIEHHKLNEDDLFSVGYLKDVAPTVSPVEWVSLFILLSYSVDRAHQSELLLGIPLDVFATDTEAAFLLLMSIIRIAASLDDMELLRTGLHRMLYVLRQAHMMWWSPVDAWYETVVGSAHVVTLAVYRAVPTLVACENTEKWRRAVLEVGESLGVLHPLLKESPV